MIQDKLIRQIARFYLDGKLFWDMLDRCDMYYLLNIYVYHQYPEEDFQIDASNVCSIKEKIKELVPFFFEEDNNGTT